MSKFIKAVFLIVAIFFLQTCGSTTHRKSEIESSMKRYDHLILTMNADSISRLYTPDGNLGNIVTGRDSIRKFLSSFKNVRVIQQQSESDSISIEKDTAMQEGSYSQTDIIADKDTLKLRGRFSARWEWLNGEGWRIKKMLTRPVKSN